MKKIHVWGGLIALAVLATACGSNENELNPALATPDRSDWATSKIFEADGEKYAPANFLSSRISYSFDLASGTAAGSAEIVFQAVESGKAFFLSDPAITAAELDGDAITVQERRDPDGLNALRVLPASLVKGSRHTMKLSFVLPASRFSINGAGVGFITSMSDLGRGNYLEAYAPASFESDAYALRMDLKIVGAVSTHSLFTNGTLLRKRANEWRVEFPSYFTSSSVYLHLTNTPFVVRTGSYQGLNATIPLTVYSLDASLADEALRRLPGYFAELEATYGPYAHQSFVAQIAGRGGMEYSGATITSVGALSHELTHSWFARGVMPSNGSSGWIDEAVASWRDFGYFRASSVGSRPPTNLGRISAFQRFTPSNCYVDGRALLAEFDFLLANQGGLRPVLASLYASYRHRTIRTEDFKAFLEEKTGLELSFLFERYIYAGDAAFPGDGVDMAAAENSHHPELSQKELEKLR